MTRPSLLAGLLAVVTLAPGGTAAQFRTGVEAVRVDVLVTERGRPVKGLTKDDFEIRDNGVLQQIDYVSLEELPLNLVLVLDTSGSLSDERLARLGAAAGVLLEGLQEDDQAALITFNHAVEQRAPLASDLAEVRAALARLTGGGYTALADAAYAGMMLAQSDADRALVVVLSDGIDTISWLPPAAVVDTAKRSDLVVYSVYTGGPWTPALLRDLASATGGSVFENVSADRLRGTFAAIAKEFRERYVVTYSPRGVAPAGWHTLGVRIKGRRAAIKARPGYMGGVEKADRTRKNKGMARALFSAPCFPTQPCDNRDAFVLPRRLLTW
jgi:Ca-activated chloride channel homolog